ncbi:hypothetical protein ACVCAH_32600 [Micromonospora sp. LZ34]
MQDALQQVVQVRAADGEAAHFRTYITALRLIVALVVKMSDDFILSAAESTPLDEKSIPSSAGCHIV